uniref:Uncharacterized protein n=1 Tax=Romanomermis culicivorax TaxID=13658 RepID=A0A915LCP7_ROMCU
MKQDIIQAVILPHEAKDWKKFILLGTTAAKSIKHMVQHSNSRTVANLSIYYVIALLIED